MSALDTTITDVSVYPDRARVVRRGTANLEPGLQKLEISQLPLALDPDSARVTARGLSRARLLGMQVQRTFFAETPSEQVHRLEEQIEALQDEKRSLEAQSELAKQTRSNLSALMGRVETYAVALVSGEMNLESQFTLFEQLGARAGELDQEMLALSKRQRKLDRQLEKLLKELELWRGSTRREAYTAIIDVEAFSPGSLEIEFSYLVHGAGWQPLYDLRLLEEDSRAYLQVGYLAQVTQNSGEAWTDVALSLSTARPALAGTLPELDPWYVRPLPPPRPLPARAEASGAMFARMALPMEAPQAKAEAGDDDLLYAVAEPELARVDTSGVALTYHVPGAVTIPADGSPQKVTVAQYKLEPQLDYVTAPKLVEASYRRARVANDSPYTLLPGQANLFAGDEFIGSSQMDLIAPQGEIEIYLGVDDRLQVKRELKRREVDKKLLGGRRRMHYGYEITLENQLPGQARVTVHDQMPVSVHEEVKVRLESAIPPAIKQTELNLLDWEFTLEPQEKRVLRFDFEIESPQGMELLGLPAG
ncbi:MAG TPA: mucoidy inhibitor MuiA family protein [Anaerolineales bacterium]